jgi:FkbM family methyltransferase
MKNRNRRNSLSSITGSSYSVDFQRVEFETGEIFFVPEYALRRPAVRKITNGEFYEPDTHRLVPALLDAFPGDMVHAGTFFGDMLPTFSRASAHRVHAFEPVLENYVLAKLCVEANDLHNVVLLNAAVGSEVDIVKIDTGPQKGSHRGGTSKIGDMGQLTSMIPIDSLGLSDVSIIQLDVEGFELNALQGAAETIERSSPIIMIEDNGGNCSEFLTKQEYTPCGDIPGLSVWARSKNSARVSDLIQSIKSS